MTMRVPTDGMQRVFLLVASTWWIFSTPDSSRREPFFQSYAISPDLGPRCHMLGAGVSADVGSRA